MAEAKIMKNPIIPVEQLFYPVSGNHELDLKAIALFVSAGFFLERDTYWKNLKVLPAAHTYHQDATGNIIPGEAYFEWHYLPRSISFDEAVEEFAHLYEAIMREQTHGKEVILPLSGGLDSRSQAVALMAIDHPAVNTYSYGFANSFNETGYGDKIARACGYPFKDLTIPRGYLWNEIERLAAINHCYSDFTHPRQMAVIDELTQMGNLFSLGHWGDVFFDDMGLPDSANLEEQLAHLGKKILKKGGEELGNALWQAWGLEGTFQYYLTDRLRELLEQINIDNANGRIRAFKSLHWATRWTSVNLSIFSQAQSIALPYYDDRMCRFVCTVPELFLAGRKMQIEYIKRRSPVLASIPWQEYDPCNLYNFERFHSARFLPARALRKVKHLWREKVQSNLLVTRNWENQFLGEKNDRELRKWLFENSPFLSLVPESLVTKFYRNFKDGDRVHYSHPLSMLLTLSLFAFRELKTK